jgi:opacity protein-like surface antigen
MRIVRDHISGWDALAMEVMMRALVVLFVVLFVCSNAYATGPSFGVGPRLGYYENSDSDEEGSYFGGAQVRLKGTPFFGVELAAEYHSDEFYNGEVEIISWPVQASALFYVFPAVYGLVGAGWYNTTIKIKNDDRPDESNSDFGWHLGGGVEIPVSDSMSISGDIRYVFMDYEGHENQLVEAAGGDREIHDIDADFWEASFGINFFLW